MIDWKVICGELAHQGKEWWFPSFEIQEFLLPLINVGFEYIDEYNNTVFDHEDCNRLKGNIRYLLDSGLVTRRAEIRYDSFEKGIVVLDAKSIEQCLLRLLEAVEKVSSTNGRLEFYGD